MRSCYFPLCAEVAEFGRRAGLRIQWSNPWGFESPLSHYRNLFWIELMKRKNEIPDFSKKKGKPQQPHGVPDNTTVQQQHVPPPPVRAGTPPATSQKSGRRGS